MHNRSFYTCSFSGHRPQNLPWKYNEHNLRCLFFKHKLKKIIINIIKKGFKYFISGMAQGADIICAEIILKLKKKYTTIELECAIPCLNQTKNWSYDYITRYNEIIHKANKITYVSSKEYFNGCMQKRNKYMIDNSSLLIAIFNGRYGGTKNTIDYAKMKNLSINILKP